MTYAYRRKWVEELEEKGSRMVYSILSYLPFLDDEAYLLYDLSLVCNTPVTNLKTTCMDVLKGVLELMNGEKEVLYKVYILCIIWTKVLMYSSKLFEVNLSK